jgi:hypothetical protein
VVSGATERKFAWEELRGRERAIAVNPNGIIFTDPTSPDNPITYVTPLSRR